MRKPIQIATTTIENKDNVYVLCDDGTIWTITDGSRDWEEWTQFAGYPGER
jgi:hypothetical protein